VIVSLNLRIITVTTVRKKMGHLLKVFSNFEIKLKIDTGEKKEETVTINAPIANSHKSSGCTRSQSPAWITIMTLELIAWERGGKILATPRTRELKPK